MSESLRSRVVEAGAQAIGQLRFDETNRAHRQGFYESDGEWAAAALDAMLDCLTENQLEWFELAGWTDNAEDLIAVLRNPE